MIPSPRTSLGAFTLALAIGVALSAAAQAQSAEDDYWEIRKKIDQDEYGYDDSQDIPWIENETPIPPPPDADDLVEVQLDSLQAGLSLHVDKDRILVDPGDRIVRLWLWIRSGQGSESGTFEGYRCATAEYKVYAYANPSREPVVREARLPQWKEIARSRRANYRRELVDTYLCGYGAERSAQDIRDAIAGRYRPMALGTD
jgi:hypothetical protein